VFARKLIRIYGDIKEEDVKNEMRSIAKLCMSDNTHRNIVRVFDHGCLYSRCYFVDMELCDLNLDHWIHRRWDETTARKLPVLTAELPSRMRITQVWDIMEDVTRAVAFIHSHHEIHRDLKPRNGKMPTLAELRLTFLVLYSYSDQAWKVTDFGLTMEGSSQRMHTTHYSRGTDCYRAPELLERKYTNKVDIWAVGCILYEMVFRRKAFASDFAVIRFAEKNERIQIPDENPILDAGKREFVSKIIFETLSVDPSARPNAGSLYQRFISWGVESARYEDTFRLSGGGLSGKFSATYSYSASNSVNQPQCT
jgi:serine/threonine protein kinase